MLSIYVHFKNTILKSCCGPEVGVTNRDNLFAPFLCPQNNQILIQLRGPLATVRPLAVYKDILWHWLASVWHRFLLEHWMASPLHLLRSLETHLASNPSQILHVFYGLHLFLLPPSSIQAIETLAGSFLGSWRTCPCSLHLLIGDVVPPWDPHDGSEAQTMADIQHIGDAGCPHPRLTGVGHCWPLTYIGVASWLWW